MGIEACFLSLSLICIPGSCSTILMTEPSYGRLLSRYRFLDRGNLLFATRNSCEPKHRIIKWCAITSSVAMRKETLFLSVFAFMLLFFASLQDFRTRIKIKGSKVANCFCIARYTRRRAAAGESRWPPISPQFAYTPPFASAGTASGLSKIMIWKKFPRLAWCLASQRTSRRNRLIMVNLALL